MEAGWHILAMTAATCCFHCGLFLIPVMQKNISTAGHPVTWSDCCLLILLLFWRGFTANRGSVATIPRGQDVTDPVTASSVENTDIMHWRVSFFNATARYLVLAQTRDSMEPWYLPFLLSVQGVRSLLASMLSRLIGTGRCFLDTAIQIIPIAGGVVRMRGIGCHMSSFQYWSFLVPMIVGERLWGQIAINVS